MNRTSRCFSPLHIGARSSSDVLLRRHSPATEFQSPSHRGTFFFLTTGKRQIFRRCCFSPLHIGARSSSRNRCDRSDGTIAWFQSPSHRGTFFFLIVPSTSGSVIPSFQSPSHRGTFFFQEFSMSPPIDCQGFSPLHIGARSSSGSRRADGVHFLMFQSPSHRGTFFFQVIVSSSIRFIAGFSPLHIGARSSSGFTRMAEHAKLTFQSPSHRGTFFFRSTNHTPYTQLAWRRQHHSAQIAGLLRNAAHLRTGGYHTSAQ